MSESDQIRFERYKEFLLENGANPEIIELQAVKDLIMWIIVNGDPIVKSQGRSPITYVEPNPDGTFNIFGKMNGYSTSLRYYMEYVNDDNNLNNNFIKLTRKEVREVAYMMDDPIGNPYSIEDTYEIYIDRKGQISDEKQSSRTL